MNAPRVTIAIDDVSNAKDVPAAAALRRAARAALAAGRRGSRASLLSVRIVGSREARAANRRWRGKDKPTNVLSFPVALPKGVTSPLLGDLLICAPLVAREAREQGKSTAAHWAHMMVHGVLHLLGHDHMEKTDAARMERLERRILAGLGHPDPYAVREP